jgi:SAM-dependent methyltransferase
MNKENKNVFDPIKSKNINDDIKKRAAFWDAYSKNFISISYAKSTKSYLRGEIYLCNKFLTNKKNSGKILKIDLWNEAHHTEILKYIHKNYGKVFGIDISPHVVKKANERLKKNKISVKTIVGDVRKMPFRNNTFDFIYTMGTIEHLPKPINAMKEISRVLKKGGRAVIGVPNRWEWFGKSIALDVFAYFGIKEDGYEHSYSWSQLEKELNLSNLKLICKEGPYFMPWPIRAADWYLTQNIPSLCFLFYPFIYITDFLSKFRFFRQNGSLLAAVVEKKNER